MELLFEKSVPGRGCDLLPPLDVPPAHLLEGLERKAPLNFMLEEPTLLRYIDATMALHNEGALYMALRPRPAGPLLPPEETERKLLDITRREGLIGPELDLLTVRERTERPRK